MSPAIVAAGAALGAGVGVLVPRVAYRLSVERGSPPRSGCASCGRPFPPGPAGWVRPGARCPACRARLGPRTWLTVLAGALSFGLLTWAFGPVPGLVPFLAVAGLGLLLAFVDLACMRLPDPLVAALAVVVVLPLALTGDGDRLGRAALCAGLFAAGYLTMALLPGGGLGFGDVKLAAVLGFALGFVGWPAVLTGLIAPHLINGPVAVVLLLRGRAGRRTALPLGPALLAGALIAVAA